MIPEYIIEIISEKTNVINLLLTCKKFYRLRNKIPFYDVVYSPWILPFNIPDNTKSIVVSIDGLTIYKHYKKITTETFCCIKSADEVETYESILIPEGVKILTTYNFKYITSYISKLLPLSLIKLHIRCTHITNIDLSYLVNLQHLTTDNTNIISFPANIEYLCIDNYHSYDNLNLSHTNVRILILKCTYKKIQYPPLLEEFHNYSHLEHNIPHIKKFYNFCLYYSKFTLNSSIKYLYIIEYDQPIDLPLEFLHIDNMKSTVTLQPGLKSLYLSGEFNSNLGILPESLIELYLGDNFNQPLGILPAGLKILVLGKNFKHKLINVPENLIIFHSVNRCYDYNINLQNIKQLRIG